MYIKKMLIIKGNGQYFVLNEFIDELIAAFRELGICVEEYVLGGESYFANNKYCSYSEYDMIFAFNAVALEGIVSENIKNDNTLIWSFLVDHPYHHTERLLSRGNNHYVSCVDRNHVKFIKRYFPNINDTGFIAHGASIPKREGKLLKERKYKVVFLGSYGSINEEDKINTFSKNIKSIVENTVQILLYSNNQTLEKVLKNELIAKNIVLSDIEFMKLMKELSFIDEYIRKRRRKMLVDILVKYGVEIDIFGNGWENYEKYDSECVKIHAAVDYQDAIRVMSDAQIVLNNLPLFMDGSHERVFTAMLCGAVCFSDRSKYFEEIFIEGESICYYDFRNLTELVKKLNNCLSDLSYMEKVAMKGKRIVLERHTWKDRAKEIIDVADKIFIKEKNEEFINPKNSCDYYFNILMNYIAFTQKEKMVCKLVYLFELYNMICPSFHDDLMSSQMIRQKWALEDYHGQEHFEHLADFLKENMEELIWIYNEFEDYTSRRSLLGIIKNILYLRPDELSKIFDKRHLKYVDKDILYFPSDKIFLDIQTGDGAMIDEYIKETNGDFKAIFSFVLGYETKEHLSKRYSSFKNISFIDYSQGDWHSIFRDIRINRDISIIKIMAPGDEKEILKAGKALIESDRLQIVIALNEMADIWEFAQILKGYNPNYKLFLRYYGGNLFPNEYVLYAVNGKSE